MNKLFIEDDEINTVRRKPRTKEELGVVRPWQNKIMAGFLKKLLEEEKRGYILKSTVLR